jgi:hypothetical protein
MPNIALVETKQIKVQGAEKMENLRRKTKDGRRENRQTNRKKNNKGRETRCRISQKEQMFGYRLQSATPPH